MTALQVSAIDDVYEIARRTDLDEVTIETAGLKHAGVLRHAMRSACFAVRPGGRVRIIDDGVTEQGIEPFRMNWPTVRSLALSLLGRDCLVRPGQPSRELLFERTAPLPAAGWSAGVVFSGDDAEIPKLQHCLNALMRQPELSGEQGEILVCGPTRDMAFLKDHAAVRYVAFDASGETPFPISLKKNHLMAAMRFPRMLVLHSRIVLDPDVLQHTPREFDILSPNVLLETPGGRVPNVCFATIDPSWPDNVPRIFERTTRHVPPERYLSLLRNRRPYADGAAFAVTRQVFSNCPLNPDLRWGDCEDVEWCLRAQAQGYLVDLAPRLTAISTTAKARVGGVAPPMLRSALGLGWRAWRGLRNLVSSRGRRAH